MVEPMESRAAAYVVQLDEIPALKDVRIVMDEAFLSRKALFIRTSLYCEITPTQDCIDKFIKRMLFPEPSLKCKRGCKAPPVNTVAGSRPRGRPRKGAFISPAEKEAAQEARQDSNRKAQRTAKTKERCENRLIALLFSSIFELSSRNSAFVRGVPSLSVLKRTGKGTLRRITNYEKVRGFIRSIMGSLLRDQVGAIRVITDLASSQAYGLPSMFISIARAFVAMNVLSEEVQNRANNSRESSDMRDNSRRARGSTNSRSKEISERENEICDSQSTTRSLNLLTDCINGVTDFAQEWWRRNATSDVQLQNSQDFVPENPIVQACNELLAAMIKVLTPIDPVRRAFRSQFLEVSHHGYASKCHGEAGKGCMLCQPSSMDSIEISENLLEASHQYVKAFQLCCQFLVGCSPEVLYEMLSSPKFERSTTAWKHVSSEYEMHRLGVLSRIVEEEINDKERVRGNFKSVEFVTSVRWHVARLWVALYASNEFSIQTLKSLKFDTLQEVVQLTAEGIFGGALVCESLFEEEDKMKKITERLREKTLPSLPTSGSTVVLGTEDTNHARAKRANSSVGRNEAIKGDGEEEQNASDTSVADDDAHVKSGDDQQTSSNRPVRAPTRRSTRTSKPVIELNGGEEADARRQPESRTKGQSRIGWDKGKKDVKRKASQYSKTMSKAKKGKDSE